MRLLEAYAVVDTFTSGLGKVEILKGGNARFILYAEHHLDDGSVENVVVAKIVMPVDAVPDAIIKATAATANTLALTVARLLPAAAH